LRLRSEDVRLLAGTERWSSRRSGGRKPEVLAILGPLAVILALLAVVACCAVAALKGKYFSSLAGFPLLIYGLPFVAAFRLARPDSWWASHRYDQAKQAASRSRHTIRTKRRITGQIVGGLLFLAAVIVMAPVAP
jgi:fatty acid desaturase